ncbi:MULTISPECIES: amino acid permease [unclassified Leifsonia]|uniref:APC family permease n=1 Tax=unclassified Leifsonia TaxID=2663824 RepID=UPI001FCE117B|nr:MULTISPECIES: amino acid permease [unclassified Leifsonia]
MTERRPSPTRAGGGEAALPDPQVPAAPHGHLGVAGGTALYIAAVLGTGILVLPALAAAAAGPGAILAVAALALISIPLAATFAALARRHPDAGGVATFARRAFGPGAARIISYWFFFGTPIGAPIAALMTARYVVAVVGGGTTSTTLIAVGLMVIPIVVTAFGVRFAASVQLVLSGALVAVLVFVLAAAAPHSQAANLQPPLPHGWGGVGLAMSLYIWAFAGWEAVAGIGGEFRNPRRDIPRATALALVIVSVAYLAIQTVTVVVLGDHAASSAVPLLDLVEVATGSGGGVVVAVIAAIVVTGVFNAYLAAFSKLGAAMGRDGDLPAWFGRGVENGAVARRGLLLSAVVMALYSAVVLANGDLQPFILVHTSIAAAVYGLGVASALRLLPARSVGWWMALLSCVLAAGLLLLAGWHLVFPAGVAVIALAVGVLARRRPRPDAQPRGAASTAPDPG